MGALLRSLALFVAVSTLETTGDVEVPCGNVTTLHLQLSWARLHVPVSFGSFHSSDDLRSMIEDVAHKMCDKHRAEHELETPRCVREITDAAFTAIASSGAEAVGEPRVLPRMRSSRGAPGTRAASGLPTRGNQPSVRASSSRLR